MLELLRKLGLPTVSASTQGPAIDNVISPSNANFKKTRDVIVEPVLGNPEDLENLTLFQDEFENISTPLSQYSETTFSKFISPNFTL